MPLAAGTYLGPYEVLSHIDAGGMGEVYRARDPRLRRDVAVKIIAPEIAADPVASARFEREARAVARLSHPNILTIYDIGTQGDATYAVMELLHGETLRARLVSGPVPVRKAVEIAIHVARGLAAAHDAGLVHRDVKPENVIVTGDGQVKILDFGLAREPEQAIVADEGAPTETFHTVTERGVSFGTPAYMAPERVQGAASDHRSDIFALGALLYELLTARPAFPGRTTVDVLHAVLHAEPDASALAHVPPMIRRIVLRCLEKRPDDRFRSCRDLAFALEAAVDGEVGTGPVDNVRDRIGARRLRSFVIGACGLVTGVLGVLVFAPVRFGPEAATDRPAAAARLTITGPPGNAVTMAASPDGKALAIVGQGESRPGPSDLGATLRTVWVRQLSGREWRAVAPTNDLTDEYLVPLTWSPDSRSLLYQVMIDGKPQLRIVDVESSVVRVLAATEAQGASWSRESGILVGGKTLRRISPDGHVSELVSARPGVSWQRWPSYLEDGKTFVFTQDGRDEKDRGIFAGRIGFSELTRVLPIVSNAVVTRSGYLLYGTGDTLVARRFDRKALLVTSDPSAFLTDVGHFNGFFWFSETADLLVASTDTPSTSRLAAFERAGNSRALVESVAPYKAIRLSPDQTRVAVVAGGDLATVDLETGVLTPIAKGNGGSTWYSDPVWSPDGRTLAANRADGEVYGTVILIDLASGQARTLTPGPNVWPQSWTPDGSELIVWRSDSEHDGLWGFPVRDPAAARRLTPAGSFTVWQSAVSPDGRVLAYVSNETGAFEVYVRPFAGSEPGRRVSPSGGGQPQWRDDGRELFYVQPDGMLVAVPFNSPFGPGRPVRLFTLRPHPDMQAQQFVTLHGGQRFVAIVPAEQRNEEFTVLANWPSMLAR